MSLLRLSRRFEGRVLSPLAGVSARFCSHSPLSLISWTEEQQALRDHIRRWAEGEIKPRVEKMDKQGFMDSELIKGLFEQGFMGVEVPPEYSGTGLGFTECCMVIEEIARVDPSVAAMVDIHNTLLTRSIMTYGTEEQKGAYLEKLATEMVGAFAISEPQSGSDAFALKTLAVAEDGGYRLKGKKLWISNSAEAGMFLVFATVDPSKGYKGITAFVVDRESEGLEIGKKEDKLGLRASSTCELNFDSVYVPSSRVLGKEGEGYKLAIGLLNEGRIGIAAQMLGLAKGAFEASVAYCAEREQFGQPIADFQGMRHQFAQAATEIHAVELMVYNCARLKEEGVPFLKEASMAKLYSSQVAERVASRAVEWMGGVGYTTDYPVAKFYRDVKIGAIYEGTSNIQLDTIAKQVLKDFK